MFWLLDLKGPMQAYGTSGNFDDRPTGLYPLRSHIVGMLAAAMGIRRDDLSGLERLNELSFEVLAWPGSVLSDFRTIGNGYNEADLVSARLGGPAPIPRSADNKYNRPVVGRKEYLVGARSCVLLQGPEQLLNKVVGALDNPVWMVFLGRANCLPSVGPLVYGPFENRQSAIDHAVEMVGSKPALTVSETNPGMGAMAMPAKPVDFANRLYAPQYVAEDWATDQ